MQKGSHSLGAKTVSGTLWTFAEKMLGQGASLIVSIFLSRLLFPEEYGLIAIASVFISISVVFIDCGLGTALIQKKKVEKIDYSTAFTAGLFISIVLFCILFFCAKPLAVYFGSKYDTQTLTNVIRLMALKLPMGAYSSVLNAYIRKNYLFKKAFWGSFVGTVLSGVLGVSCAYMGFGVYALIIQTFSDGIIDTLILTVLTKWVPGFGFSVGSFKGLFGFGSKIFATTFIDRCYNSLTDFVIGKQYAPADLALFNKGKQLPHLICTNIEGSIDNTLFPAMSQLQDNKDTLKKAIRKSVQVSSYVIFPLLVGLICVGKPLVVFLFTDKWVDCAPYLIIFCISYLSTSIRNPILQAIKAIGRSDVYLALDIPKKVVGLLALIISVRFGPLWICIAAAISSYIGLFINIIPSKKLLNYSIGEMFLDVLPSFVISSLMGAAVYFLTTLTIPDAVLLLLQILTGIFLYIALSLLTKNSSFTYLFSQLKSVFGKFSRRKDV